MTDKSKAQRHAAARANIYRAYEQAKRELRAANPEPEAYEKAVRIIAERLGL